MILMSALNVKQYFFFSLVIVIVIIFCNVPEFTNTQMFTLAAYTHAFVDIDRNNGDNHRLTKNARGSVNTYIVKSESI